MIYKNYIRYDFCVCEFYFVFVFMIKIKIIYKLCFLDYMCDYEKEVKIIIVIIVMGILGVEILFSIIVGI